MSGGSSQGGRFSAAAPWLGCVLLLPVALLAACGPSQQTALPRPPPPWGDHPAIGRPLDVEVLGPQGASFRLQGAVGRLTLLCIDGPLVGAKGELTQQPGVVATRCAELAAAAGDRLSIVGIATGSEPPPPSSYRSFRDPGGAKLLAKLPLRAGTEFLVLDRQRRVAAVIEAGSERRLDEVLRRLDN